MCRQYRIYLILLLTVLLYADAANKCASDEECSVVWPGGRCIRSRCRCPMNTVKKKSPSRDWICLSVVDAVTGESGPPLTCPLPEGAGYQVILRNDSVPQLCSSKMNDCPMGYECIQGLSFFGRPDDGICCPDQDTSCIQPIFDHEDGFLDRWGFDGKSCVTFKWNPEKPSSANNFKTEEHCSNYCIKDKLYNACNL